MTEEFDRSATPRIVVTGASGFVGTMLVPLLRARGADLLLVGRDSVQLRESFGSDAAVCTYEELPVYGVGFDAILHLAVLNNGRPGELKAFREANVTLVDRVVDAARNSGIGTLIVTGTTHASSATPTNHYAVTKAEMEANLAALDRPPRVVVLRLPAVYGERFAGNLSVLNRLPSFLRESALALLSAFKPVVCVERVVDAVMRQASASGSAEHVVEPVSNRQISNPVYEWTMRAVDLTFSVVVFGVFFWLLIAIWIAVRSSSPGPGLFAQERVGRHGKSFTCYKFRTMQQGTAQKGTHNIGDSAVTSIGGILRKTKLDELPQAWNILLNEMSFVGPRPCLPEQTCLLDQRRQRGVLDVKGGITGFAQIRNIDMSDPVYLAEIDAEYIANRSILLDFKIIIATLIGSGRGDRVSRE